MDKDINIGKLFKCFREDMKMNQKEWDNFCKRYTERDPSTIVWYIEKLYGVKLKPNQIQEQLDKELIWSK